MTHINPTDRRTFLRRGAMGAGAFWTLSLDGFMARRAEGASHTSGASPYGPIAPVLDETTNLPLIQLPRGFRYWSYSWTGDMMSDGVACPSLHDGMAVIDELHGHDDDDDDDSTGPRQARLRPGAMTTTIDDDDRRRSSRLVLVRNHEPDGGAPYVKRPEITYARRRRAAARPTWCSTPARAGGWPRGRRLAGTIRNCAGGVTPWGTWITCEETVDPGHGWSFEVGRKAGDPTPLVDMGRFSHEALMVDPHTGYVYETEDSGDCRVLQVRAQSSRTARARREAVHAEGPETSRTPTSAGRIRSAPRGRCSGCGSTIRAALFTPVAPAGLRQGRRPVQSARRRVVGRADRVLPLDQRRQRGRGPGVRVRPARRDAQAHLRLAERERARQPRQHRPSRRAAACCSARTPPATASRRASG